MVPEANAAHLKRVNTYTWFDSIDAVILSCHRQLPAVKQALDVSCVATDVDFQSTVRTASLRSLTFDRGDLVAEVLSSEWLDRFETAPRVYA